MEVLVKCSSPTVFKDVGLNISDSSGAGLNGSVVVVHKSCSLQRCRPG